MSYYAVRIGRIQGIFRAWAECQKQVKGYSGCKYKKFSTEKEALNFIGEIENTKNTKNINNTKTVKNINNTKTVNTQYFYRPVNKTRKNYNQKSRTLSSTRSPVSSFDRKISKKKSYGRAGSRTKEQKNMVRDDTESLLKTFKENDIICYTDGACSSNPGFCGAGCYLVYNQDGEEKELRESRALGRGTNNIGELTAIEMAIDLIQENNFSWDVKILTDSRYSLGILTRNWKVNKNKFLVQKIKEKLNNITNRVDIYWVGGHSGVLGNEEADRLANLGVEESRIM